jgi:membrane fusion protein
MGEVSLAQPNSMKLMTVLVGLVGLAIILLFVFGTYTRRTQVTGRLIPTGGMATVVAPSSGVVEVLSTREGDVVNAGQKLAVIRVPRSAIKSGDTQAALMKRLMERRFSLQASRAAQAEQFEVQGHGLRVQLKASREEQSQLNEEIKVRLQQVRIAQETLERLTALSGDRFVSILQVKQQESTVLLFRSEIEGLRRQLSIARRSAAQLEQSLAEIPAQRANALAEMDGHLAALEQELVQVEAEGALVLTSPVTGQVANELANVGQAVEAGKPILAIIPQAGILEAELAVPSRAVGFISPGDRVLLRYQAYPYQKFGHHIGHVKRISRGALTDSGETNSVGASIKEPYYRITVSLQRPEIMAFGKAEALKPGMLIDADILGERRRLLEWALEPLYTLSGRISGGQRE